MFHFLVTIGIGYKTGPTRYMPEGEIHTVETYEHLLCCSRSCGHRVLDKLSTPWREYEFAAGEWIADGDPANSDRDVVTWGDYPCPEEADYDQFCPACGRKVSDGLEDSTGLEYDPAPEYA